MNRRLSFEKNSYLIKKKVEYIDKLLFCFHIDLFENGKYATFIILSFQLRLQYFKCSEPVVSENKQKIPSTMFYCIQDICSFK